MLLTPINVDKLAQWEVSLHDALLDVPNCRGTLSFCIPEQRRQTKGAESQTHSYAALHSRPIAAFHESIYDSHQLRGVIMLVCGH